MKAKHEIEIYGEGRSVRINADSIHKQDLQINLIDMYNEIIGSVQISSAELRWALDHIRDYKIGKP